LGEISRRLLEKDLIKAGYEVVSTKNVREALNILKIVDTKQLEVEMGQGFQNLCNVFTHQINERLGNSTTY